MLWFEGIPTLSSPLFLSLASQFGGQGGKVISGYYQFQGNEREEALCRDITMGMTTKALGIGVAGIVVAILLLVAFSQEDESAHIVIGVPGNSASAHGTALILETLLEEHYNTQVRIRTGEDVTTKTILKGMDEGVIHIHPEVWDSRETNLLALYADTKRTIVQTPHSIKTFQGLCLSSSLAEQHLISQIQDLRRSDVATLFDWNEDGKGEILVSSADRNIPLIEKIRAKSYRYDHRFDIIEMDDQSLFARIQDAMRKDEPVLFHCYTPHEVWNLYDIVSIQEPTYRESEWNIIYPEDDDEWLERSYAGTAWKDASIGIYYVKSLEADHPEIAKFLNNVRFRIGDISQMVKMLKVDEQPPQEYATEWIGDNQSLVEDWIQ
ncbi:MAG: hypothetical protein F4X82_00255 [Candidatus Spechtbacteria bacterium SB0662_bin_43]|uniref:ABC-type glycine betaine transport system substrate-binding domain-containing protein n=1 Tax=Candidatus Spechtbacteria bacterium SB0662_bin_43 TaxID=2604897 RepID=A0A845D8X3_9BACT|nr:hypothetical protein [Candidatus Spechtbacteria bacterium SB0662_bin_43]